MKRGDNLKKYDHTGPTYKTRPDEYRVWSGMKVRCSNPNFKDWHLYGGRGIAVCERWRNSFELFFADVGPRPSSAHSLDRYPDPNGDYEPRNVRWATRKQQARNWATRNRLFTHAGEALTLSEWAERLGIARESLRDRINGGWSIARAVTCKPIRKRGRHDDGTFAKAIDD